MSFVVLTADQRRTLSKVIATLLWLAAAAPAAVSQEFFERYEDWPQRTTLKGTLCAVPSLTVLRENLALLRGSLPAGRPVCMSSENAEPAPELLAILNELSGETTTIGESTQAVDASETSASPVETDQDLPPILVWYEPRPWEAIHATQQLAESEERGETTQQLDEAPLQLDEMVERLKSHIFAGGTAIVVGEVIAGLGDHSLGLAANDPAFNATAAERGSAGRLLAGMGLLDRTLLTCPTTAVQWDEPTVCTALQTVGSFSIQLSNDSLLLVLGRTMFVLGPGNARLLLPNSADGEPASVTLAGIEASPLRQRLVPAANRTAGEDSRSGKTVGAADWTQWRRRAMELSLEPFPPAEQELPRVEQGSLLIVGGGGMPRGLMSRFIELAGGAEQARLVYVPCSEEEFVPPSGLLQQWRDLGVQIVSQIHTKDRQLANEDAALLEPLREATGIWFGGGRQWNFADSYYGTEAHRLMKEVLKRGGVIGGSSAGASIQASYLARATPIGNSDVMAPGYERGGLGFISGVAIDQHFSQRNRQADQLQLVARHRQLLGIGIDEATALEVRDSRADVLGKGQVYFAHWRDDKDAAAERVEVVALAAGQAYDLAKRQPIDTPPPQTEP